MSFAYNTINEIYKFGLSAKDIYKHTQIPKWKIVSISLGNSIRLTPTELDRLVYLWGWCIHQENIKNGVSYA